MPSITVEELDALVTNIFRVKEIITIKEEELSAMHNDLKSMEMQCVDFLKDLGLETFKGKSGTITPYEKIAYTVPKTPEDREKFFGYLKEQGEFDGMITVNYNTLNGYAKNFYESAKERGDLFATIPGLGAPTITTFLSKTKKR